MKKLLFLIYFLSLGNLFSQVSSYTFNSASGTYTPITGGANADNFATWTNTVFFDDGSYAPQPIGFNFTYEGTVFTTFGISQNGFIVLGAQPLGTTYTPLSTIANAISPMGADLIGRGSLRVSTTNANPTVTVTSGDISQILVGDKISGTGIPTNATVSSKTATTITMSANATSTGTARHFRFSRNTFGIRYLTSGTAPNRTCTIQFTGFQRYTTSGYFGELYNFQIKLNETTNTVQFVYNILGPGLGTGSATATTFQIGLRGTTAFNNRTTTTNWSSTTAGTLNTSTVTLSSTVKPTSGLTYTWTPPLAPPCSGTPSPGNTLTSSGFASAGSTVNLSLQTPPTGTGLTYQWQSSSDNTNWTNFGTSLATQSATVNATTFYRCIVTCSSVNGTSASVQVQLSACVPTMTFGCTDGDVIARVQLNTLDNNSGTGCPSGTLGYSNYTSNGLLTTTLQPSTSYNCIVTAGQYNANYAAWIDYNDDLIFQNSERIGFTTTAVAGSGFVGVLGSTASFPVTLACTPPAGMHILRIREVFNLAGSLIDPCTNNQGTAPDFGYGEIEDYKITIATAPTCPSSGLVNTITPTSNSASLTWSQNCSVATTYDIEYGVSGFAQGTGTLLTNQLVTINSGNATYNLIGLNGTTTYDVYYRANCGASQSSWSIANTFTTLTPPPVNDNPSGAIEIFINNQLVFTTYTNVASTNTTSESLPSCANYAGGDVWFKIIVVEEVTILNFETQAEGITDAGMSVYRGNPGSLIEVSCNDDFNGLMPVITINDALVGETLYVRVWEYGGNVFGTFRLNVNTPTPLPIELKSLQAVAYTNYNILEWTTSSEYNTDYYLINSSIDGIFWKTIGSVSAAGNSNQEIDYNFVDYTIENLVYYELRQFDIDGVNKTYGPVSAEKITKSKNILRYTNILGQDINPLETTGVIIIVFTDGTTQKMIR